MTLLISRYLVDYCFTLFTYSLFFPLVLSRYFLPPPLLSFPANKRFSLYWYKFKNSVGSGTVKQDIKKKNLRHRYHRSADWNDRYSVHVVNCGWDSCLTLQFTQSPHKFVERCQVETAIRVMLVFSFVMRTLSKPSCTVRFIFVDTLFINSCSF